MTSENKDKIRYKVNLKPHLEELNCFTSKRMEESDLLSIEETKRILEQSQQLPQLSTNKFTIPFQEKRSERFKKFVAKLQEVNSSSIYIWIDRTNDCGTSIIGSLSDINWEFDFDCSSNGIFVLESIDLQDRVLFDFFEEDGQLWLEIEASGIHWSKVNW